MSNFKTLIAVAFLLQVDVASAGLCDVAFGMRMTGGLVGGDTTVRVIGLQPSALGFSINYVRDSSPTVVRSSEIVLTKMGVSGGFDSRDTGGIIANLTQLRLDETGRNWLGVTSNGKSGALSFSPSILRWGADSNINVGPNGRIIGIWPEYDTTVGVPRVRIQAYFPPPASPSIRDYNYRLYCPGVYHSGFTTASASTVANGADTSGQAQYVSSVTLEWRQMSREIVAPISQYRVYRSEIENQLGQSLGFVSTTVRKFVDNSVSPGKRYFYTVRPILTDNSEVKPLNEDSIKTSLFVPLNSRQKMLLLQLIGGSN